MADRVRIRTQVLSFAKVQAGERLGRVGYSRQQRGKAVKGKAVERSRVWIYFVSNGSPPDASGGEQMIG